MCNCKNGHKLHKNLSLPENFSLSETETACLIFVRF